MALQTCIQRHTSNSPFTEHIPGLSHARNVGSSMHDPIIIDEDPSPASPSSHPILSPPNAQDLSLTLLHRHIKSEDMHNCSEGTLVLRELPERVQLKELANVLKQCDLLKVLVKLTLFQQDHVALVEFPSVSSASGAARRLEDMHDPFPHRRKHCKLVIEPLTPTLSFHTPSSPSRSQPISGTAKVFDSAPTTDLEDASYGRVGQIYVEMEDALASSDEEDRQPWLQPAVDTAAQPNSIRSNHGTQVDQTKGKRVISDSEFSDDSYSPEEDSEGDRNIPSARKPISRPHYSNSEPKRARVSSGTQDLSKPGSSVRLPKVPFGGARRVLIPATVGLPMVTVSMRADIQFFDIERRLRISSLSMPALVLDQNLHLEAAIMLNDTVVLGFDKGPYQVSLVQLAPDQKPARIDLGAQPHDVNGQLKHTFNRSRRAVSCLAAMSLNQFVSGGFDRTVQLWSLDANHSKSEKITSVNAAPSALACRGEKLLVSQGKTLELLDVMHITKNGERYKLSNTIWHVHEHPHANSISVLEVDNLDQQALLFDTRKNQGYDREPDCALGYRSSQKLSRYYRGSISYSYFVRGYPDRVICLWDFRNPKAPVVKKKTSVNGFHTAFLAEGRIVAAGDDTITFLDTNLNIV
ncbi:hypothetical protein VNI00_005714 [Paramarasmius palmivorus]|uniref:Uncharacterized protein n=1 Tax=Paramarasmius palmivorus TaxID=297713 RepID=A0AAW0DDS0_9AGAR